MSMLLAVCIAAHPFVCDANWWRQQRWEAEWPFPRMADGVYAVGKTCTPLPQIGYQQILSGQRIYVPRNGRCTLYDDRLAACLPVAGPTVTVRAWVAGANHWREYELTLKCGTWTNEVVHTGDFDNAAWFRPKGWEK